MFAAAKRAVAALGLVLMVWPAASWAASASTNISAQVCPQPGAFASTTLTTTEPNPTTNTSAAMSGTAEPASTVNITVNSTLRATVTTDPSGNFGATVPLAIGDNTIVATADDGAFCGDSSTSPPVLIHRNQVPPPAPAISSPLSGTVTTADSVLVSGSAEIASTLEVLVNNAVSATLTIGADGLFSVSVPLGLGANAIQARATNPAGTGPVSAPVNVTRNLPPVVQPPPSSPPKPAAPVASAPPAITSPTDGTTTSSDSVTLQLQGSAGATALVSDNGTVVATVKFAADGTASVLVPLAIGDNSITVTVNGQVSPAIVIHHPAPAPIVPIITGPLDGSTTHSDSIVVSGKAAPGVIVTILNGKTTAATVTTDSSGSFSAHIALHSGLNLIHVEISAADGTPVSSEYVQVNRITSAATGESARRGLAAILTVPAAALVLTGQGIATVLGIVASSPAATMVVLACAVVASTAGDGLLGLELLLLIPGLLRALRQAGSNLVRGRVVDTVTGRPLALAVVTSRRPGTTRVVTSRDGSFSMPAGSDVVVTRPGYRPGSVVPAGTVIALEPSAAAYSRVVMAVDFMIGTISWLSMLFAAALGIYLVVHQSSPFSYVVAALSLGLLGINLALVARQPHYRWGRLTDLAGRPLSDAEVTLAAPSGPPVSTYRTDASGRYTLHAWPGQYQLKVKAAGKLVHEEPVTIRHRPGYLGWKISARP